LYSHQSLLYQPVSDSYWDQKNKLPKGLVKMMVEKVLANLSTKEMVQLLLCLSK
jgi:hypothetical protein